MLPQPTDEQYVWLGASEVSDQATIVLNDIRVSTRAIRSVGHGWSWLEGPGVVLLRHLSWTPHHVLFLVSCEPSIVHGHVGVSARAVTHIAGVLGVKGPAHC